MTKKSRTGVRQAVKNAISRVFGHSQERNMSRGAEGAYSSRTVAHKDQWRGRNRNHHKAK